MRAQTRLIALTVGALLASGLAAVAPAAAALRRPPAARGR